MLIVLDMTHLTLGLLFQQALWQQTMHSVDLWNQRNGKIFVWLLAGACCSSFCCITKKCSTGSFRVVVVVFIQGMFSVRQEYRLSVVLEVLEKVCQVLSKKSMKYGSINGRSSIHYQSSVLFLKDLLKFVQTDTEPSCHPSIMDVPKCFILLCLWFLV